MIGGVTLLALLVAGLASPVGSQRAVVEAAGGCVDLDVTFDAVLGTGCANVACESRGTLDGTYVLALNACCKCGGGATLTSVGTECDKIAHCPDNNVRCPEAGTGEHLSCAACDDGFSLGATNTSCVAPGPQTAPAGLTAGMTFISMLAEFFYGLTSFGPAITFNIGWQILFVLGLSDGSLTSVTVNLMVMELFSASIQLAHLWKYYDVRFSLANVVPTLVCTAIGTMLLIIFDSVWLKRALAGLLISLALQRVRARCRADAAALMPLHQSAEDQKAANTTAVDPKVAAAKLPIEERSAWAKSGLDLSDAADLFGVVLCGVGIGLIGGIFGVGGPPGMIFVSYYDERLDLNVWRACSAIRRVGMNLARLVIFLHGGQLDIEHQYPLYLGMLGGAAMGLLFGNILNARWKVDAKKLHWFIVSLMIYGGILLAVSGSSPKVEQYTTGLIVSCALLSIFVAACLHCYTRRTDRRNSSSDQHERLIDKYSSLTVTSTPVRRKSIFASRFGLKAGTPCSACARRVGVLLPSTIAGRSILACSLLVRALPNSKVVLCAGYIHRASQTKAAFDLKKGEKESSSSYPGNRRWA